MPVFPRGCINLYFLQHKYGRFIAPLSHQKFGKSNLLFVNRAGVLYCILILTLISLLAHEVDMLSNIY